jgi:hypothetical protein
MWSTLSANNGGAWEWPDSLDALIAAPGHHKLVLENERVRVLDTHIPAGDVVPVHTHRWPAVYYTISPGEFVRRDGEGRVLLDTRITPTLQGQPPARFIESLPPHSVENVGTSEIHLISFEMKTSLSWLRCQRVGKRKAPRDGINRGEAPGMESSVLESEPRDELALPRR